MAGVNVKGQPISLGGTEYILPPLALENLPDVQLLMKGGSVFTDKDYTTVFVDAIYLSLLRNYPEMERKAVSNHLDILNYVSVSKAFETVNGFTGSGDPVGEVTAGQ